MKKLQYWCLSALFMCFYSDLLGAVEIDGGSISEITTACAGCHGPNGNSGNPDIPNLAGQNAEYIVSQLNAFRNGARQNNTMQTKAAELSDDHINEIGRYYSRLDAESNVVDKQLAIQGKSNYTVCWGCHGMNGEGNEGYPRLADQHPAYLIKQINNFKDRSRVNPAMNNIAQQLTNEEIEAISAYLGSINLPALAVAR